MDHRGLRYQFPHLARNAELLVHLPRRRWRYADADENPDQNVDANANIVPHPDIIPHPNNNPNANLRRDHLRDEPGHEYTGQWVPVPHNKRFNRNSSGGDLQSGRCR